MAYFTEGRGIRNRTTLIAVVVEAGLERQVVKAMLNGDEGMDVFTDAGEVSRQHGVSGGPFFIINKEITLSGAQQPDTFLEAFRLAIGTS